jgi:hypothetical protein
MNRSWRSRWPKCAVPAESDLPGLDVGLPYLAATYDERMYETLRTRAQVFEILTGGDPTADRQSEASWLDPDSEGEVGGSGFVALPKQMLEDLRMDLSVKATPGDGDERAGGR